jgi:hypothetical protein
MPGTRRNQTRKASNTRKAAKAAAKPSTAMVATIRKVARTEALKTQETKFVLKAAGALGFNSAINGGFTEMYTLIPPVAAGDGTFERLDDCLQPLNIRTNWHIALTHADRSMNIRCVLYCLQDKRVKYYPDLGATTTGPAFLKSGVSDTPTIYNGNIGSEDLPVNNKEYTLLKCFKFNLIGNVGLPNGDQTAGNSPNAMPSYKNLSYTYPIKSQLKYSENALYNNGHAPFWVLGYSHTDGTVPDVLNQDLSVSYVTQMTYKDA